jgi:hypothetical protein
MAGRVKGCQMNFVVVEVTADSNSVKVYSTIGVFYHLFMAEAMVRALRTQAASNNADNVYTIIQEYQVVY